MLKKIVLAVLLLVVVLGAAAFAFFKLQIAAFDESVAKKYDVPLTEVVLSDDPAQYARGKHLAESLGACNGCHGDNFAGGRVEDFGPMGSFTYPNITGSPQGALSKYTDAQLFRLLKHGLKADGTTVLFMPVHETLWWPDSDRVALIGYLRKVQPVAGQQGKSSLTDLAKLLDRLDKLPFDIARRIDHTVPAAVAVRDDGAEYGKGIALACRGCHGEQHLAGGRIPGTPPEVPEPPNLTPHESGLKDWSYEDFTVLMREGKRKNGKPMNPMMPIASFKNYDETEMKALWAYLRSLPAVEFGKR